MDARNFDEKCGRERDLCSYILDALLKVADFANARVMYAAYAIYIEVKLTAGKREKVDDIPYTGEPEYNVVRDARFRSFRMLPFSMVGVQKDEVTIILFGNESREYWSYYV